VPQRTGSTECNASLRALVTDTQLAASIPSLARWTAKPGLSSVFFAPAHCSDQYEQEAENGPKGKYGNGQLDPNPEISNCRFKAISPRVWKL
jgi:hypothetical protein